MNHLYDCNLGTKATSVFRASTVEDILGHLQLHSESRLWVCDTNTFPLLPAALSPVVVVPAGEGAKTWGYLQTILGMAKDANLARDSHFIAFGGGVVCDMTGFAASVYMRGAKLTLVPTTLLSMVDASLGGKTAIDLFNAKNLVGTFYPADELLLCTKLLSTLPKKEYQNGLGEVLKHALLSQDTRLFDFLELYRRQVLNRELDFIEQMVELSLQVKRQYIEQDPKEQFGIRDALNLGHTFAHALETVGNLTLWSHGEAVAWGVVRAIRAGSALKITAPAFAERAETLFCEYGFDTSHQVTDPQAFLMALAHDKKTRKGQVRFVLMEGQGKPVLTPLNFELIEDLIG